MAPLQSQYIIEAQVRIIMKEQNKVQIATCPQCRQKIPKDKVREHIFSCEQYVPIYANNIRRLMKHITPTHLQFLISEMDIIRDQLIQQAEKEQINDKINREPINGNIRQKEKYKPKEQVQSKPQNNNKPKSPPKKDYVPPQIQPTINLEDIFKSQQAAPSSSTISCADPQCTNPVKFDDIERYTYIDQCLHPMCKYCFRNYVRNNYVKSNGFLQCPNKKEKCQQIIKQYQIRDIVDPAVLNKLETELNSKVMNLIQCQKCNQQYQFEKGKASDAPKKTPEGKNITTSMAKHFAENRFYCSKCKSQQCKNCKEIPYHLGFSCQEFREHKSMKKCRYCRRALPKGYMSESGIKTFDDICDSVECSKQMKNACSKRLPCGHSCLGIIKQKNCPPCLEPECAIKNSDVLHGQNKDSYCSLCYVESLGEAPCIQSKCGHIFHLKCLEKRIQLKWGSPRITFRFCECPLCNKWLDISDQCSFSKDIRKFKALEQKIKDKAMKRLRHENEDKSQKITDPKSPYFKDQIKYAMTIYAYFECYECGQPYFGGRKSCAQAMNEGRSQQKYDPKQLICPSCCPAQSTDCKKHGKQFISFKCRFCCSVAQWFCWGNTHFCDGCHKKQLTGQYVSRLPKDKLPKCQGKGKCPVGGQHGGNGAQFCLGCGICRGDKMGVQDF